MARARVTRRAIASRTYAEIEREVLDRKIMTECGDPTWAPPAQEMRPAPERDPIEMARAASAALRQATA